MSLAATANTVAGGPYNVTATVGAFTATFVLTNAFFNNAPTGQIFINRAKAVNPVPPFKGPNYFAVNDAMQQALSRVDVDKTDDAAASWAKFVTDVKALG